MTEETIINGVDVSVCEKLGETIDGITCGLGKRIRFANEIITKHNLCKDNPNCYYKQCKRLEHENQELGKIIDCKNGTITSLAKVRDKLKEENKKLKEKLEKIESLINKLDLSLGCTYGDYNCDNCSDLSEEIVCSIKLQKVILDIIEGAEDE